MRRGDEIVACGHLFHTGTRVVLWTDPGGYDAYRAERHFAIGTTLPSAGSEAMRFGTLRRGLPAQVEARVRSQGWRLADLRDVVRQVVLHYDAAGTSARCFEILHDVRGLSTHFLLDVDGTIYQTLDVKERAWHATVANDASVGVEIANIGAYPDRAELDRWYVPDEAGVRLRIPDGVRLGALPADLVARPATDGIAEGVVHGVRLWQYDLTPEQYEALARLLATLSVVFPQMPLDAPRDAEGHVDTAVLSDAARQGFSGVLGHWHVDVRKVDPGPAFRWDVVLARARTLREGARR